jgi:hypothetical protein
MLTRFLIPAIAMPAMLVLSPLATPAQALTTLEFGAVGDQGRYEFRGLDGQAGTDDLFAALTLEVTSRTASSLTFSYRIENLAGGDITSARLQSFGFDVDGLLIGRQATGTFDHVNAGNVPGMGYVDACFLTGGNSCGSNAGAGLVMGAPDGSGTFRLSFLTPLSVVTLRDSYVRWRQVRADDLPPQGVSGLSAGIAVEMPLPEPQSWALMVAGFGLVGFALRRGAVRQTIV